jgi:hypothetical protein
VKAPVTLDSDSELAFKAFWTNAFAPICRAIEEQTIETQLEIQSALSLPPGKSS